MPHPSAPSDRPIRRFEHDIALDGQLNRATLSSKTIVFAFSLALVVLTVPSLIRVVVFAVAEPMPNYSVNRTPEKLRFSVPSALRAPAAPQAKR
jgi:hypothetical protein